MNLQRAPNDSSRPRRSARHVQLVLRRCHLQKFRQFAAPSTIVTSARNAATIHTLPCKMIETQLPRAEKFRLNAANCEQLAEIRLLAQRRHELLHCVALCRTRDLRKAIL